jgi:L-ascorbate metabolism protein UlaG (beta-lactamase superfamily)
VLTDPNFLHRGERVHLGKGRWTTRRTDPAIGELADLDLVVLSHLHGDHFDRVAREGLDRSVPIATTPARRPPTVPLGLRHPATADLAVDRGAPQRPDAAGGAAAGDRGPGPARSGRSGC